MVKVINLPDFEDMYSRLEAIKEVGLNKLLMAQEIEEKEAEVVMVVTTEEKYFIGGKSPSMAHISRTYLVTGLDDTGILPEMRRTYARQCAEYEYLKMRFDLDKIAIDVWRTQSANERKAID